MTTFESLRATIPPQQRDRAIGAVVAAAIAAGAAEVGILRGDAVWLSAAIGPAAISGWLLGARPAFAAGVSRPAVEIACLVSMITIGLVTHGDLDASNVVLVTASKGAVVPKLVNLGLPREIGRAHV